MNGKEASGESQDSGSITGRRGGFLGKPGSGKDREGDALSLGGMARASLDPGAFRVRVGDKMEPGCTVLPSNLGQLRCATCQPLRSGAHVGLHWPRTPAWNDTGVTSCQNLWVGVFPACWHLSRPLLFGFSLWSKPRQLDGTQAAGWRWALGGCAWGGLPASHRAPSSGLTSP